MPRFGMPSMAFQSPPAGSHGGRVGNDYTTPETTIATRTRSSLSNPGLAGGLAAAARSRSVNLSCTSGDGRHVFSVGMDRKNGFFLERNSLPLASEDEPYPDHGSNAYQRQKERLPPFVQAALELSPPIELVYIEADSPVKGSRPDGTPAGHALPTLLCLYTRKNAYFVELTIPREEEEEGALYQHAADETLAVTDAFESYMMNADDAITIVRIQAAPQRRMNYATMCPRGAMAMLTHNPISNEYALVLQHNREDDFVSQPLVFSLEQLSGTRDETITDFCFAQSDGDLALLSSIAILLLKGSGDVLAASPIVFDGSVVSRSVLEEAMDYLDYVVSNPGENANKRDTCKAARVFLQHAFVIGDSNNFATGRVLNNSRGRSVTWPVQLQGQVLAFSGDSENDATVATNCAVVVQNFFASDLVGVAVGREGDTVDLGVVSPSNLIPRFALEAEETAHELNLNLTKMGAVVQRLRLRSEEDTREAPYRQLSNQSLALLRDPLMDTMLHFIISSGITTVTTTAMRQAVSEIERGGGTPGKQSAPRTSAWSSVSVASDDPSVSLEGVIVGSDTQFGHALIARLSNGTMIPVNVTESRYLHEMDNRLPDERACGTPSPQRSLPGGSAADAALKRMEALPPLHESVEHLLKKVATGLAGMGKIVGSDTRAKDISPEMMAVALSVKERCDSEVVLPLLELKKTVTARREILATMHKEQLAQIAALKETVATMQERMGTLREKAETAQDNATELAKRSASVLQASRDLMPSITQAEYDYFQQLKRLEIKCNGLEKGYTALDKSITSLRNNMDKGKFKCQVCLKPDLVRSAEQLLDGQENMLRDINARMKENQQRVDGLAAAAGLKDGTVENQ